MRRHLDLYYILFFAAIFGIAENLISCDFENGFCDWSDVSNFDYDWTIRSGRTPDHTSGPRYDHTLKDLSGHYTFSNGARASRTSVAILRSATIATAKNVSLTFWFQMNGNGIGNFSLVRRDTNNSHVSVVWTRHGRQGVEWRQALVPLRAGMFKLEFETTVFRPFGSDIALDDIQLSSEPQVFRTKPTTTTTTFVSAKIQGQGSGCGVVDPGLTLPGTCNFDFESCGYISSSNGLQWLRYRGQKKGWFTQNGINGDHSTGAGYYMYLGTDKSGTYNGERATLTSPPLAKRTVVCLQFAYIIASGKVVTLSVFAVTSGQRHNITTVATHTMWSWSVKNISVCAEADTKFAFEAEKEGNNAYVGLDDIKVTSGACGVKYSEITPSPFVKSASSVSTTSTLNSSPPFIQTTILHRTSSLETTSSPLRLSSSKATTSSSTSSTASTASSTSSRATTSSSTTTRATTSSSTSSRGTTSSSTSSMATTSSSTSSTATRSSLTSSRPATPGSTSLTATPSSSTSSRAVTSGSTSAKSATSSSTSSTATRSSSTLSRAKTSSSTSSKRTPSSSTPSKAATSNSTSSKATLSRSITSRVMTPISTSSIITKSNLTPFRVTPSSSKHSRTGPTSLRSVASSFLSSRATISTLTPYKALISSSISSKITIPGSAYTNVTTSASVSTTVETASSAVTKAPTLSSTFSTANSGLTSSRTATVTNDRSTHSTVRTRISTYSEATSSRRITPSSVFSELPSSARSTGLTSTVHSAAALSTLQQSMTSERTVGRPTPHSSNATATNIMTSLQPRNYSTILQSIVASSNSTVSTKQTPTVTSKHHGVTTPYSLPGKTGLSNDTKVIIIVVVCVASLLVAILIIVWRIWIKLKSAKLEIPGVSLTSNVEIKQKVYIKTTHF